MGEESTTDGQQIKRAGWRSEFLRLPTPLEWVVIVGVVFVAYVLFFMPPVMDNPTPEQRHRLQERKQQQVEPGERLQGVSPD